MATAEFIHYISIVLTIVIPAMSVSIGQGYIGHWALKACDIQPSAKSDILKTAIFGCALTETSALIGLTISLFLLLGSPQSFTLSMSLAQLGIACAICLPGAIIGLVSAWPAQEACLAIARQPFFQEKITRVMLLIQSIIQTPIIFGFIIAIFIKNQLSVSNTLITNIHFACSGLCLGLGSIGPAIGLALFGAAVCRSCGINRNIYNTLISFTLISAMVIETPIIFALIVSLIILTVGSSQTDFLVATTSILGAALCMGFGTLGTSISSGRTASTACHAIALEPDHYQNIARLSMLSQGVIDTSAIYTFTIAMLLIFSH